ncbi:four helix bundle protein [candidate division WWE3 bacterium CG10_big_fil_rev_8_21_14_0_10_32_10]|uniref:Four helix bundle protein n=1 Tax=candidate division WWE3 bacterium CG10_big_fil_rev_8_21_14_0_10_32_10 TaxID=1975090 RepID=A0A2H0RCE9_UNCKA|nr:MAG: four helix bundle protein [candidate division WWE3 bacterium CG10_big_fil_rev_8_21_14_0_10_32_10]
MGENKSYDLEERTATFGEDVIEFTKKVPINAINGSIITQLVKSGTSIGANYAEANGASSKKDFKNKIYICKKESKETMFWLRIISKSEPTLKKTATKLWEESKELTMIFSKIVYTINNPANKN